MSALGSVRLRGTALPSSCDLPLPILPHFLQSVAILGSRLLNATFGKLRAPGCQPSARPSAISQSSMVPGARFQIIRGLGGTEVCEVEASITESCSDLKRRVAEHLCVCRGKIQLVSGKFVVTNGLKVWRILRSFGGVLSVVLRRPPEACTFDGQKVDPFRGGSAFAGCLHEEGFCCKCMREVGVSAADIFDEDGPPTPSVGDMRAAGYSIRDLLYARPASTTTWLTMWHQTVVDPRMYRPYVTGRSLFDSQFKAGGYTATDFRAAGYAASQLSEIFFMSSFHRTRAGQPFELGLCSTYGWSCVTCEVANEVFAFFTVTELKCAGYSAVDLHNALFPVEHLRHAGFSFQDVSVAGYTPAELSHWDEDEEELLSPLTDEEVTRTRRSRSRSCT